MHTAHAGAPGADVAVDTDLLRQEVAEFCHAVGLQPTAVPDGHVREMYGMLEVKTFAQVHVAQPKHAWIDRTCDGFCRCRYGGAGLHNVAAVLGGVIAQETIKLLTHQFVPLDNTFIFNGVRGSTITANL